MRFLRNFNSIVARLMTVFAAVCLAVLVVLVMYSVVMRYVFDDAQDYVEPIGLLLVLFIAFIGAALKLRDGGHIGLDSLVKAMPPKVQRGMVAFQHVCLAVFAVAVCFGSWEMAITTFDDQIPILNLPEAIRYLIPLVASVCIILFSLEHLLTLFSFEPTLTLKERERQT
ncbi:TRAP transporter small permease [Paraburkholderia rhizosphaerae]|uniref:TRAP transporter small permease protein n=1 Tax=Paraburkholderia rhizosphaerae TaxID=480658 RepID=A0A4R8LSW1_9BURK|nr:TRAP transporter small permease [Paraburkholderia rhizosphaerae]TDY50769.1 TRAP-type C4-dicarboxylate transport system permease small subunit [Paraburkholderia rhizosphaerae]